MKLFRKIPDPVPGFACLALLVAMVFATLASARPDPPARKVVVTFEPRLEFPLKDDAGFVKVGKDRLIPVKVIAKLKNSLSRDENVFWRLTATAIGAVDGKTAYEDKWSDEYDHLAFVIKKNTDVDRTFFEKIQMPPGYYRVLVELCTYEEMPDLRSGVRKSGTALAAGSFLCTVPGE